MSDVAAVNVFIRSATRTFAYLVQMAFTIFAFVTSASVRFSTFLIGLLPSIVNTAYSGTMSIVPMYTMLSDAFATGVEVYFRFFFSGFLGACNGQTAGLIFWVWSVYAKYEHNIDVPAEIRRWAKIFLNVLLVYFIVGMFVGPSTWMEYQTETQQAIDKVWCWALPFFAYWFDAWNQFAALYRASIGPLNVFLDILYDNMAIIADRAKKLVGNLIGLLVRSFSGETQFFTCSPISHPEQYCALNGCFMREFVCWVSDVIDFLLYDVIARLLALYTNLSQASALRIVALVENLFYWFKFLLDTVISFATGYESSCVQNTTGIAGGFWIAKQCAEDATRCAGIRLTCFIWLWFDSIIHTWSIFLEIFANTLNSISGTGLGTLLKELIPYIQTLYDFVTDIVGNVLAIIEPLLVPIEYAIGILQGAVAAIQGAISAIWSTISSILSGGGLFVTLHPVTHAHIIAAVDEHDLDAIAKAFGVTNVTASSIIPILEIANKSIRAETGVSPQCVELLGDMVDRGEFSIEFFKPVIESGRFDAARAALVDEWFCIFHVVRVSKLYHDYAPLKTWPQYKLLGGVTDLPEEHECKQVLERDLFFHLDDSSSDMQMWLSATYAPCALAYLRSYGPEYVGFPWPNTPTHNAFVTLMMSKHAHRIFPNEWWATETRYSAVDLEVPKQWENPRFLDRLTATAAMTVSSVVKNEADVHDERMFTLTPLHASNFVNNKLSIYHGNTDAHIFESPTAENWEATMTLARATHQHRARARHAIAAVAHKGTTPPVDRVGNRGLVNGTIYSQKPWVRQTSLFLRSMGQRKLLATGLGIRTYNIDKIIKWVVDFIFKMFILFIDVLLVFFEDMPIPGIWIVVDALDVLKEFTINFDMFSVLIDIVHVFGELFWKELQDCVYCGSDLWYDARQNTTGPWKAACLLSLKLPPELPEAPDVLTTGVIPWGTPCATPIDQCRYNFEITILGQPSNLATILTSFTEIKFPLPVSYPCATEYLHCRTIGFTDGVDVLFYYIEAVSRKPYLPNIAGFFRGPSYESFVLFSLRNGALAMYPAFFIIDKATGIPLLDAYDEIRGYKTTRDVRYLGEAIYRWENNGVFLKGPFYNFCKVWRAPSGVVPFILLCTSFLAFAALAVGVVVTALQSVGSLGALLIFPTCLLDIDDDVTLATFRNMPMYAHPVDSVEKTVSDAASTAL